MTKLSLKLFIWLYKYFLVLLLIYRACHQKNNLKSWVRGCFVGTLWLLLIVQYLISTIFKGNSNKILPLEINALGICQDSNPWPRKDEVTAKSQKKIKDTDANEKFNINKILSFFRRQNFFSAALSWKFCNKKMTKICFKKSEDETNPNVFENTRKVKKIIFWMVNIYKR